jgi:exosome complex RNA-binding protein Rrp42 (RNase PH superfamily)
LNSTFLKFRLKLDTTDIVVGVKVEVGEPDPLTPQWGRLQINVEWYSFNPIKHAMSTD